MVYEMKLHGKSHFVGEENVIFAKCMNEGLNCALLIGLTRKRNELKFL